jgi:hypothetical protein
MVLGGGADHGRPADIDILDTGFEITALRDGLLERIEIDRQDIDRTDAVRLHGFGVRGIAAYRQQAAMHGRVQRLDAAVHHFGETGEVSDVEHFQAGVGQRLARAAGRNQFDAIAGETAGEFDHSGFVGHGNESAGSAAQMVGHGTINITMAASAPPPPDARRATCRHWPTPPDWPAGSATARARRSAPGRE